MARGRDLMGRVPCGLGPSDHCSRGYYEAMWVQRDRPVLRTVTVLGRDRETDAIGVRVRTRHPMGCGANKVTPLHTEEGVLSSEGNNEE